MVERVDQRVVVLADVAAARVDELARERALGLGDQRDAERLVVDAERRAGRGRLGHAAVVRELGLALGRPSVALERLVHVGGRPLDLDVRRVVLGHLVQPAEDPQGRGQVVRVDHGDCGGFGLRVRVLARGGGLVGAVETRLLRGLRPPQVLGQAEAEEHHGADEEQEDHEGRPAGLDVLGLRRLVGDPDECQGQVGDERGRHGAIVPAGSMPSDIPANRSSSGYEVSTNGPDQLEVLGRRDLELDLPRDGEPEAVRVDLGGVREQRLVADPEVLTARHLGGDPLVPLGLGLPLLEPLLPGRLQAVGEHRLVQGQHPRAVERVVVVELEHLPRLAELGVALRVRGRLEGRHRHLVAPDVVGVRVAAALVVRRHHVRLELRISRTSGAVASSSGTRPKQPSGSGGFGSPSGQPESTKPSQSWRHAEDVAGPLHLLAADLGDVGQHVGPVHLRVEDRAALAAGARHHVHVDALRDVHRGRRGALARLVVGVGVHVHQPEPGAGLPAGRLRGMRHVFSLGVRVDG